MLSANPDVAAAAVTARWAARLSSLLIQGNGAVVRATQSAPAASLRPWCADAVLLPHTLPVKECEYDLLCFLSLAERGLHDEEASPLGGGHAESTAEAGARPRGSVAAGGGAALVG